MKLFFAPGTCSQAPHIALREVGLRFELSRVDVVDKRVGVCGDYLDLNPLGYVPLLELDDGSTLREVPVILQYIADQVPQQRLAPPVNTMERYRLQEWLNFITSEIHKGFVPLVYAERTGCSREFADAMRRRLKRYFGWIDVCSLCSSRT